MRARVLQMGRQMRVIQAQCAAQARADREQLRRGRVALVELSGSLAWSGAKAESRAVGRLVEHAIAEGALASFVTALEDGRRPELGAGAARIHALWALAERAGKAVRPRILADLVEVAAAEPDMEDTAAWVRAALASGGRAGATSMAGDRSRVTAGNPSRATSGNPSRVTSGNLSRAQLADAAVAAAGRAEHATAPLHALEVAPRAATANLVHLAVARLAHALAGIDLGARSHDSTLVRDAAEGLTRRGARELARVLGTEEGGAVSGAAPYVAAASVRLLARAVRLLPAAEARVVAARVLRLAEQPGVSLDDEERAAVVDHLEGDALEAALGDEWAWSATDLAVRLAALGRPEEARALIERSGGGWGAAVALLRAARFAPKRLGELARDAVAGLDPPARGRICGENPAAAVSVLGPDDVVRFAEEAGDETGQYVRIVALARVAGALPEPQRSDAAALAVKAYRHDPDADALGEIVRCAPWMPAAEAAWLLFDNLGRRATPECIEYTLSGYSGVAQLAPLIARAGGDVGLLAAAAAVRAAGRWVRR